MMKDSFGRSFKTLRISLLSNCNFACVYCTDDENTLNKSKETAINITQLLAIVAKLHQKLQLQSVRLTGGEPLLFPDLELLIKGLIAIDIPVIKMTSNGFLLENKAENLKSAGLQEINISLDAANEASFFAMTRRDKFKEVSNGIDAAVKAGLKVKINSVIMKGKNDDQIIPLIDYAFESKLTVRFLEVMNMGNLHQSGDKYLCSQDEILDTISLKYQFKKVNRKPSSTANYWETNDGNLFGIIANSSEPFCADCNRLRLDQNGNIYGCLSVNEPISVIDNIGLDDQLYKALRQKQSVKFAGSSLSMLAIGG